MKIRMRTWATRFNDLEYTGDIRAELGPNPKADDGVKTVVITGRRTAHLSPKARWPHAEQSEMRHALRQRQRDHEVGLRSKMQPTDHRATLTEDALTRIPHGRRNVVMPLQHVQRMRTPLEPLEVRRPLRLFVLTPDVFRVHLKDARHALASA